MTTTKTMIREFAADVTGNLYVRGVHLARELRCRELRSKKHGFLAVVFDELGNVFVLDGRGRRSQLVGREIREAGIAVW